MLITKKIATLLFLLITISVVSQVKNYRIEGAIVDKNSKNHLEAATVYIQEIKDSTVINYTTSNADGSFLLQGKSKADEIKLFVSFIGYKLFTKKIKSSKTTIQLDSIFLAPVENMLNEIVIQSSAPITIKKDTVEFNPNSFKTKKDATVEDFLKKLPGVEIDDNGAITVNGVSVDKVLVNGKPFFGDDPKIALQNLTKDIINKIQITDTKTKAQAFTGEVGNKTNKTINITIKKDKNRGVFGRVSAGIGTQNRLDGSTSINLFDDTKNLNILANGNQSHQEGKDSGLKNIQSGKSAGTNFSTRYGKDNTLSSSYYYNTNASETGNITERENIIPDHHYFSNTRSNSKNDNNRHRVNLSSDIKLGETVLLSIRPSFSFNDSNNESIRKEESIDDSGALINSSNSSNSSSSKSQNFNTSFNLTKRLGTNGSFFKFRFNGSVNKNDGANFIKSKTAIFGASPSNDERNQLANSMGQSNNINMGINYRLPIKSKQLFLDLSYYYSDNNNTNTKSTYDYDSNTQNYDQFNDDLSNDSKSTSSSNTTSLGLTYRKDKWYGNIGANYILNTQENKDALRQQYNLKKDFNAINFGSRIRYSPNRNSHISIRYNLRNNNPSLGQLNPFKDISNPLNIITGNPALKATKNHSIRIDFNSYNTQKKLNLYSNFNIDFQNDKVVSKTSIMDDFVRYTSYTNVNGNYRINFYTGISKTLKLGLSNTLRINLSTSANYNNAINFSNNIQYTSKNTTISPRLKLNFNWKDLIEIEPSYRIAINKTDFNIAQFADKDYINQSLELETRTNFPKNLEWNNTINYQHNSEEANGLQPDIWTWNTSISYTLFKDRGLLSLRARDILNQNNNIRRSATDNYIQYSQNGRSGQNIMLAFRWKFNTRKG